MNTSFKWNPDGSATITASVPIESIPVEYRTTEGYRLIGQMLEARLRISLPESMRKAAITTAREMFIGK